MSKRGDKGSVCRHKVIRPLLDSLIEVECVRCLRRSLDMIKWYKYHNPRSKE